MLLPQSKHPAAIPELLLRVSSASCNFGSHNPCGLLKAAGLVPVEELLLQPRLPQRELAAVDGTRSHTKA